MLKFTTIKLKSGEIGEYNDIPDITVKDNPLWFEPDENITEKERENIGKGMVASVLPYRMQNLYNRDFKERTYTSAVLENEYLRAEFLPEFGGRLWSLYDKKLEKDIIYKNDALIFCNLAICNAWFAGGVEWNCGVRGHSHFTCSPLFTRKVIGKAGNEILRMYEYEEIRGLVFCIEATLSDDKLIMNITVKNTKTTPTYMYWWSNIAVEQKEGTRYFVPASRSFVTSYREGGFMVTKIDIPISDGKDISDPYHSHDAIDYFFDIPEQNKKWISSIEADGKGLLQYSSDRLFGRKAFLWGNLPGGKHWNQWLTSGRDYLEIQAGLCKTQFEHFPIEPFCKLNWTEVYKGIDIKTPEGDYFERVQKIDSFVPENFDYKYLFEEESVEPITVFGRGKGYLYERLRGYKFHEKCEFPRDSVNENEKYYLNILNGETADGGQKTAYIYGKEWINAIEQKACLTAFDKYILALLYYSEKDFDKSLELLLESVKENETFYSLAALSLLLSNIFENHTQAVEIVKKAVELNSEYLPTVIKYGEISIKAQKYEEFINYYNTAPEKIKNSGRVKMYVGHCLVATDKLEEAKTFINKDLVIEDIREGEYAISNVWVMLYKKELAILENRKIEEISNDEVLEKYPLPYDIDFLMH